MEAEYVVLARASKEGVHFRRLLAAMGIAQTAPLTVFDDNQSAINLTNAPAITKHSRHINVRYHLIRDLAFYAWSRCQARRILPIYSPRRYLRRLRFAMVTSFTTPQLKFLHHSYLLV
jgi:hypothetical protein